MKKVSSSKKASPIRMPKGPKKTNIVRRKKKFTFPNIFKKENSKYPVRRKNKKEFKYLLLPIFFLILIGLIFLSIKYILFLREGMYSEEQFEKTDVIGLEGVPAYGGSTFLFTDNMDDSVVKEFLSQGNSAYKLPPNTSSKEVDTYYFNELKNLGWEFIELVPIGSPDKKYGQYWVKEGKGLRIYSKFNDVWYESITEEDSRTALANLVKEEIEREMLLASSDKQSLLPDFPWKIDIPKEYLIRYSPTTMKDLRAVSFQKMGSEEVIEIYPVGNWKEKELDFMLNDYCKLKSTEEIKYGVMNSVPISFRENIGLKSTIQAQDKSITAYTVPNTFNSIVYVISTTDSKSPLFLYIIENIKPLGSKD